MVRFPENWGKKSSLFSAASVLASSKIRAVQPGNLRGFEDTLGRAPWQTTHGDVESILFKLFLDVYKVKNISIYSSVYMLKFDLTSVDFEVTHLHC